MNASTGLDKAFLVMLVPTLLFCAAFVALVVVAIRTQKRKRAAFLAAFADDPNLEAFVGDWRRPLGVRTRHGAGPAGELVALGGGKNDPLRWEAFTTAPRVVLRTTVTVTQEGLAGALREKMGFADVHTGDDRFDDRFCLRGSDADVVRGIFVVPAVRAAVDDLFAIGDIQSFSINDAGRVHTWAGRSGLQPRHAREVLKRTMALAAAIEEHADVLAALPPATRAQLADGTGGGTGSPVAVSVSVPTAVADRRRR
jgi:hypothetical protein